MASKANQTAGEVTLPMTSLISPKLLTEYRITLRLSVEPVSWKYWWAAVEVPTTSMVAA